MTVGFILSHESEPPPKAPRKWHYMYHAYTLPNSYLSRNEEKCKGQTIIWIAIQLSAGSVDPFKHIRSYCALHMAQS